MKRIDQVNSPSIGADEGGAALYWSRSRRPHGWRRRVVGVGARLRRGRRARALAPLLLHRLSPGGERGRRA